VAVHRLEALGYTNVRAYEGGKEEWIGAGLAVESGVASPVA
jgi:rhodanese-related sulfurtransferase